MNSIDLMFFAAVADAGGIGRAAGVLHTVQSNVTGRIRTLERALGTLLFHRGSRGVTLTGAGERLLPYARQVAGLLADAEQAVLSEAEPRGLLRLGSMETTAALRLPRLLTEYADRYPEVEITLETGPTEVLVAAVLDRRIEGAFVSGPVIHAALNATPILREELVLVAGPRLRSFEEVIASLAGRREGRVLVFKTGCSYRLRLEALLAVHGLVRVRRMEFGTLDGIIGCVEAGMGVSMLPRIVTEPSRAVGRVSVHAIPGTGGDAETLLAYRKDGMRTAAFACFLEYALKAFALLATVDASVRHPLVSRERSGGPLLTPEDVQLVQNSFDKVKPISDTAADLFYGRLFEIAPQVRDLFPADMADQKKKLMATLAVAVANLGHPEVVAPTVEALGRRHAAYRVEDGHYALVGEALIWTLERGLGNAFTPEVRAAWVETYGLVAGLMRSAAGERIAQPS